LKLVLSDSRKRAGAGFRCVLPLCLVVLILGAGPAAPAQENDDCLMCHADPDMTGMRGKTEISVFVDEETYGDSMHGGFDCVMCHSDLMDADLPHADDVEPVD